MQTTNAQGVGQDLPKEKQTPMGLYVTSREAYEMWKTSPDTIKILDVRTPEEYLFVGHAEMAWNVPGFIQHYQWDAEKQKFPMTVNPSFLSDVQEIFAPDDQLLVTCRSGGRSALAIHMLAKAGYKNLYNIVDGFEGDTVNDVESVFNGLHMRNGWKNSGLPYTFSPNPVQMRIPKNETNPL
ncbi:MAG: rhodanese-like domain-containing protein [Algoriphagus sp.]|nr:rhodanese-like domain-containing protein [Algoriphagus sp.]